jgi:hypothetical protein
MRYNKGRGRQGECEACEAWVGIGYSIGYKTRTDSVCVSK